MESQSKTDSNELNTVKDKEITLLRFPSCRRLLNSPQNDEKCTRRIPSQRCVLFTKGIPEIEYVMFSPFLTFLPKMKSSGASLPTSGTLPIPRKRGMPEETGERVISGLRPKKKSSSSATGAGVVTKRNHSGAAEPFIPRTYQLCHNPLERLCELLANWRVLHDLANVRRGSTIASVTIAENEEEEVGSMHQKRTAASSSSSSSNVADLVPIPISFLNYRSYVQIWEPLLITELQANVLSNTPSNTRQGHHGIAYVSSMGSSNVDSKLVSLNCNFVETVVTSSTVATRYNNKITSYGYAISLLFSYI